MKQLIPNIFSVGAIALHIAIILIFIALIIQKRKKQKILTTLFSFLSKQSYILVFIFSLIATLGSLFYSEILKFQPCILCWYQRIFMYPLPLLVYTAVLKNERVLKPYLLLLNIVGGSIALYHYILQRFPDQIPAPCSAVGASVSCIKGYSFHYGYISIPLMALTIFVVNIILLYLARDDK